MNGSRSVARLPAPRLLGAASASTLTGGARASPLALPTASTSPPPPGRRQHARPFSQMPFPYPQTSPAQAPSASIPMPYITEVTSGGWRTYDIFSKLLQERIICVNGAIDDTVSASVVAQLLWLESDNPEKPITMYIHSPGGSVTAGLSIYDTMNYIRSPVHTVCLGQAASMGSLLLTGGCPGKRFALPNSSIMIHQPLGGTQGPASDILIYANQIQRTRHQVNHIYLRHLNAAFPDRPADAPKYDIKDIEDMMERDKYLSADEAKDLGIVDEIMIRRDPAAAAPKDGKEPGST